MASTKGMRFDLGPVHGSAFSQMQRLEQFLQSANAKWDVVFQAAESMSVTALGFSYNASVGTPPVQRVSLQTVLNGAPTGTVLGSATFRPPEASANPLILWNDTFQWIPINATAVSRGQFMAMVVEYDSGTVSGIMSSSYHTGITSTNAARRFPTLAHTTNSGTRVVQSSAHPVWGYRSSTGAVFGAPTFATEREQFSSGGRGARLLMPAGMGTTFKIAGIVWVGTVAPAGSYDVVLYNAQQEQISRVSVDTDYQASEGGFNTDKTNRIMFAGTLPDLNFGSVYYIHIVPTGGSPALTVFDCTDSEGASGWPTGDRIRLSQNFSVANGKIPLFDIILDDIGGAGLPTAGPHLKFMPRWNDPLFIQHADDQIQNSPVALDSSFGPHEQDGVPIGMAIESYGGFETVEVFRDPDASRSVDSLVISERPIEQVKILDFSPWIDGTFEIVFRLRAKAGSPDFVEVVRELRVIT